MNEHIKQALGQPKKKTAPLKCTKDLLYGELAQGERPTGRPQLHYQDVCKMGLKTLGIVING